MYCSYPSPSSAMIWRRLDDFYMKLLILRLFNVLVLRGGCSIVLHMQVCSSDYPRLHSIEGSRSRSSAYLRQSWFSSLSASSRQSPYRLQILHCRGATTGGSSPPHLQRDEFFSKRARKWMHRIEQQMYVELYVCLILSCPATHDVVSKAIRSPLLP